MRRCSVLFASLLLGMPLLMFAQSEAVVPLKLRADPALDDGTVAIVEGRVADAEGLRYMLSGLSILQPIAVTLLSSEENPTLELSLHLSSWDEPVRTAALDGDVWRTVKFRTQGDVGIRIRTPDNRAQAFALVAWVGSPVEPRMEDVVVSPERYRAFAAANPALYPAGAPEVSGNGDSSSILTIIAVLLAGIFLLLAILVFRKVKT